MRFIYYLCFVIVFTLGSLLLQGCTTTRDGLYLKYLKEKDSISYYRYKYNEAGIRYLGSVFIEIDSSLLNERDFYKNMRRFRHDPLSKKYRKSGDKIACAVILTDSRNRRIFDIGKPLTSDTVNFVNMLQNMSLYFKNAGDFKLLSYERIGTLTSKKDVKKYIEHNLFNLGHVKWQSEYVGKDERVRLLVIENQNRKNVLKLDYKWMLWTTLDDWYTGDIQKGDGIWKLSFLFEQKPYEGYIFINPSTHKVTYEGSFKSLEFDRQLFPDIKTAN